MPWCAGLGFVLDQDVYTGLVLLHVRRVLQAGLPGQSFSNF